MSVTQILLVALALGSFQASAQTTTNAPGSTNSQPPPIETDARAWSCSASAYTYIVPDSREYVQPTFAANRGWLHLEARYNYEAIETGSAWVGYNFGSGEKLAWEVTPMLGGVFGDTAGIAPGYKLTLSYWKLELASEGEYLFDLRDSAGSYFYNWSELSVSPVDWFRVGLAAQRTRLYHTDLDIQRGFLVGFNYKQVSFTTYVFNPDASRPTIVLGLGFAF